MSALPLPLLGLEFDQFASLAKQLAQPHVKLGRVSRAHVAVGDVIAAPAAHQNCAVVPPEFDQFREERSAPLPLTSVVNDTSARHQAPRRCVRFHTHGTIRGAVSQAVAGEKFASGLP